MQLPLFPVTLCNILIFALGVGLGHPVNRVSLMMSYFESWNW